MDGDHTSRTSTSAASSALPSQDFTEGIFEAGKPTSSSTSTTTGNEGSGTKTTGQGTSIFSKDGVVGKQFTADDRGAVNVGGKVQEMGKGGVFDKEGEVGGLFTADDGEGVGGKVQERVAKGNERH